MSTYGPFIFKGAQHHLAPITARQVLESITACASSAAGPDHWAQSQCKHLSLSAARYLAHMYNCIESGADWPHQMQYARSVFLSKSEDPSMSALNFRILSICSF
eukprot:6575960-Alexandrium_andersonii.AAC.1